jgi:hypothetical protein
MRAGATLAPAFLFDPAQGLPSGQDFDPEQDFDPGQEQ